MKKKNKWVARININKELLWLGTFETELEAHLAYQEKLKTTL
ncbi:MAG: hypothetical protein EKK57_03825 [Proteobacteria bacterium]|nr:MAG: hypothetical protein EKK57_03825 [Pseudomonadota bacterium]